MIACNAAIVTAPDRARAIWHFHDLRVAHEVGRARAGLAGVAPPVVATHARGREAVERAGLRGVEVFLLYRREELRHERTVVETAIQIADELGFASAYLLGVDCAAVGGEVYARALRFKPCHFKSDDLKVLDAVFTEMRAGLSAARREVKRVRVWSCSPLLGSAIFPYARFEDVIEEGACGSST